MTKNVIIWTLIAVGSVLIITGVVLMGWIQASSDDLNVIDVQLEEGGATSVEFKDFGFVPGDSREYTIKFKGERSKQYNLSLDFVEKEDMTLKNFARVKILANDNVIYDELLADAFEGEAIKLSVDFDNKENTELVIVYYLPSEVGNEAKNAEAIFDLQFIAESEGGN